MTQRYKIFWKNKNFPPGLSGEPLLGLARDFHPLDNAHAERTTKKEACREASFVEVSSGVEPLYTVLQTVT